MLQRNLPEKLFLKTSAGKKIPAYTLAEALEHGIDFNNNRPNPFSHLPKKRYIALTEEYNLSNGRDELLRVCEQQGEKPYVVIYEYRFSHFFAAVCIPAQPTIRKKR